MNAGADELPLTWNGSSGATANVAVAVPISAVKTELNVTRCAGATSIVAR